MSTDNLLIIRDYNNDTDRGFVGSYWFNGLKYGNTTFRLIPDHTYLDWYGRIINRLVDTSKVKVACLQEDETVTVGFSVFDLISPTETHLHWIYVKEKWRNNGIAKLLLPQNITVVTHLTKVGLAMLPPNVQFKPYEI